MDYRNEAPEIIKGFLTYHETIKGQSKKTVDEYFLDLRTFFRYMKIHKGLETRDADFQEISIMDIDLDFVESITISDIYEFLTYLSRDREKNSGSYGLNDKSRARKIATLRSYYKYLTTKAHLLETNPIQDLDSPKIGKSLPRYLTLDESISLLGAVEGPNKERDYCILTLFLNCGLRISELIGMNIRDIKEDHLRVTGKGNKQRIIYLNDACIESISSYLEVRKNTFSKDKNALFISRNGNRVSRTTVHNLVKKHLSASGLDSSQYSSHKLRHTAATLMLQNGVDVKVLQDFLGHDNLNTTQIYTHVDNTQLKVAARANPLSKIKPTETKK